ncbi:hypothetical protein [Rhizobium sp. C4]|uniref:hypothetical protein n=1 Tax=Rhizobium sp. C4 TaxID=1349800 RepID=UPI001E58EFE0|nr:hypothetical protein [Rhizobium sp. C4]MCD2175283.1 hypothetical protein [Rhizobium sp. C4]
MMNFADLVLCLLTGFAIPLALSGLVSESVGSYAGNGQNGRVGRLVMVWSSAMICGPGLFATRLVDGWRSGDETVAEQAAGWMAAAGWAALYGYVVLNAVKLIFVLPT